jgi:hypothetical protein
MVFDEATQSHIEFRREGSLYKEKHRISKLPVTRSNTAGEIFSSEMKFFGPRYEKVNVEKRRQWREQFKLAHKNHDTESSEFQKFPFAVYNDIQDLSSYEDIVRALVRRSNSDVTKKRYPSMPSIVVAVTPCDNPGTLDQVERLIVNECDFDINPLTCVWLLSSTIAKFDCSGKKEKLAMLTKCKIVLFYLICQLKEENAQGYKELYDNHRKRLDQLMRQKAGDTGARDELEQQKKKIHHYAVDFVKSSLDKDRHADVIMSLSRAESAVLIDNDDMHSSCNDQPYLFMSICQMIRAMKFCGKPDAFLHPSDKVGLTRIFIVSDTSLTHKNECIEAFRSGACLIMARGNTVTRSQLEKDIETKTSVVNHDLPTLCLFFQSVSLTLRSIEMFFRYFLHHMAFVKQSRVECDFCPHTNKPIAERVQRLKKSFNQNLHDTKLFYEEDAETALDWTQLGFLFRCMSLLQESCMHHHANDEIRDMWQLFSNTKRKKGGKVISSPNTMSPAADEPAYAATTPRSQDLCFFQPFDKRTLEAEKAKILSKTESVTLAINYFNKMLSAFDFFWYEPFEPEDAGEEWHHSFDQIAEIAESTNPGGTVCIIPEMNRTHLTNAISRVAITCHHACDNQSASVRLFGETALMSAACLGRTDEVELLMQGCSLSQILCRSQHPQALGLDALFMSLFYGHCAVAKAILKRILEVLQDETSSGLPDAPRPYFCVHVASGVTSLMLACRYGDKDLLDNMFKFLDKCGHPRSVLLSSSEYNDIKRTEELLRKDHNNANALHHAIVTANAGAVEWLKNHLEKNDVHNCKISPEEKPEALKAVDVNDETSVFENGVVSKELAPSILSPTFALLCILHRVSDGNERNQADDDQKLISKAIRSDFDLVCESLKIVDALLMTQSDFTDKNGLFITHSTQSDKNRAIAPLQEYELAVMMWGLCVRDATAKQLPTSTRSAVRKDVNAVADDEEEDLSDSEAEVRKKIAMQLTEFSEETDRWESQWFKVCAVSPMLPYLCIFPCSPNTFCRLPLTASSTT